MSTELLLYTKIVVSHKNQNRFAQRPIPRFQRTSFGVGTQWALEQITTRKNSPKIIKNIYLKNKSITEWSDF